MTDESTMVAAPELEIPAIEPPQPEAKEAPEISEGEGSEAEGVEQIADAGEQVNEQEPEFVEIEINGKTYQVPAELKDGYMMQADYTRKTQSAAELKRQVEAQRAEAEAAYNASQEYIKANAQLLNLDEQLSRFQNVDWRAAIQEDPMGANEAYIHFQQLKEKRAEVAQSLEKTQAMRSEQAEREFANRLHETREFAQKEIPGWSPEVDAQITNFALSELGIKPEQLKAAIDPVVYKTLHLAWLGAKTMQKQAIQPKPQAQVKPLQTVRAQAAPTASKSPEQMTEAEYIAWRKKQRS